MHPSPLGQPQEDTWWEKRRPLWNLGSKRGIRILPLLTLI